MNNCKICHEPESGFTVLGAMPPDKIMGRDPIWVCTRCCNTCPCGNRGYWWDGLVTCKHGFSYDIDYETINGSSHLIFNLKKRKWWSCFVISRRAHDNYLK